MAEEKGGTWWITAKVAAERLGCSDSHVNDLCNEGHPSIVCRRFGRLWRIDPASVEPPSRTRAADVAAGIEVGRARQARRARQKMAAGRA